MDRTIAGDVHRCAIAGCHGAQFDADESSAAPSNDQRLAYAHPITVGENWRKQLGERGAEFSSRSTSVLILIVDATPNFGCTVRLVGSKDLIQMPVSPVCLDTLVLATVGAAKNLGSTNKLNRCLSENGTVRLALAAKLTVLICRDIEDPLLLSGKTNKILMRELFPQSKQKASAFGNRLLSVAK